MTQSDVDAQSILHDAIRTIAEDPTGNNTISYILNAIVQLSYADAGLFTVFNEAETLITANIAVTDVVMDDLTRILQDYVDDLYVGTDIPDMFGDVFHGWMIIPIMQEGLSVGALILFYGNQLEFPDQLNQILESLINLLRIITSLVRLKAQHLRHNRNRQEFLRVVTHDMRSPLTSMHGFGSMLESDMAGDLNDKQSHFLSKIMSGIAQLTLQIDNMQDAGRYDPETGFYEMSRAPTDLIDLVERLVENALIPSDKQSLQLKFHADATLPIVNVDSAMVERSVVNLIDNAVKYTPDGGQIDVYVRHVEDDIIIAVEDNGYGISVDDTSKLFNRHFRIHRQEYKRIKGSGLGLFIVRSVARKHNGDAWVESVEGEGSTFLIRIPLAGKNLLGGE